MRQLELYIGNKKLELPCFFPSVSSVKTNFPPNDYIDFLNDFGFSNYLISSYDIINNIDNVKEKKEIKVLPKSKRENIIFLDSGNYEAFWLNDFNWNLNLYQKALKLIDPDMFFSFDGGWKDEQINNNFENYDSILLNSLIPIIHGNPKIIGNNLIDIAQIHNWKMIGIPERELGDGLIQRAKTLSNLFKKIRKEDLDIKLHLLGTGNPISILLYSACGAVSFDGLEWCKTVVNPNNAILYHFSQRELFICECLSCNSGEESYSATTLAHNLLFYIHWMKMINDYLKKERIKELLIKYFPKKILIKIGLDY